jgi:peptidoglycan/LPS O-acetylase OafA/YrhL
MSVGEHLRRVSIVQLIAGAVLLIGAFLPIADDGSPYRPIVTFYQDFGIRTVAILSVPAILASVAVQYPSTMTRVIGSLLSLPSVCLAWYSVMVYVFLGDGPTLYGRYLVEYSCYALLLLAVVQFRGAFRRDDDAV